MYLMPSVLNPNLDNKFLNPNECVQQGIVLHAEVVDPPGQFPKDHNSRL